MKYGTMQSSLGFAATSLLGLDFADMGATGMHTKPASYKMSKQGDEKDLANTFYDDTGRGLQSLKVQRLLDRAKKVIARDNKKAMKEQMKLTGGKSNAFTSAGNQILGGTANTNMYKSGANLSAHMGATGYDFTQDELDQ